MSPVVVFLLLLLFCCCCFVVVVLLFLLLLFCCCCLVAVVVPYLPSQISPAASLVLFLLSFPTVRAITGVDLQSIIFCQQIAEISMRSPESERSKMLVAIQSEAQVIAGQTLHIFCKLFRHQQWPILLQHLGHHQTTHFLE